GAGENSERRVVAQLNDSGYANLEKHSPHQIKKPFTLIVKGFRMLWIARMLIQSSFLHQMNRIWIFSAECTIHFGCITSSTFFENMCTECLGSRLIEETFLFESCERIRIQYLCPDVSIVTCRISSGEDVLEIRASVSRNDSLDKPGFIHSALFESVDITTDRRGRRMVIQIQ